MVSLIIIYHYAGYVNATLLIVLFGLMSGLAASFLCEAMASIKGNDRFQSRVEMMSIARLSLPRYAYYCTLMIFIFNLLRDLSKSNIYLCWWWWSKFHQYNSDHHC
jgi:ABC-type dipeptide/oligopeptide/nickel transport system permease component